MIRYWGPETNVPVHSHPYDEMWYVLEGEVIFGDTIYTAGSCVYIPKNVPSWPGHRAQGGRAFTLRGRRRRDLKPV